MKIGSAFAAPTMLLFAPVFAPSAQAKPVGPTDAPVERLITNVQAYLKQHPYDPQAYFTLGRIYYFAFARKSSEVPTYGRALTNNELPELFVTLGQGKPRTFSSSDTVKPLSEEKRKAYIKAALTNLQKAIALRDKQKKSEGKGLYELCLACAYEDGGTIAAPNWQEKAIATYLSAYRATILSDSKTGEKPMFGLETLVSYEAGNSYTRMVTARGVKPAENIVVADVKKGLKSLEAIPPSRVVSPIVFSLQPGQTLTSVLRTGEPLSFNLDGTGAVQRYSTWPKPDTALLVWDPKGQGNITSGRQLFGNATWWLFWENGYQALNALDNNHNGWLEGTELHGLALWFDRNGNGKSDKGEVVPISRTPIAGIATQATGKSGLAPMNSRGLRLRNGQVLPTWDWVVSPLPPAKQAEQK
jgi:hypothetical protein